MDTVPSAPSKHAAIRSNRRRPFLRLARVELAQRYRLPAANDRREFALSGGLITYGANARERIRRVAAFVDRILKGAKPGDLPIEQPTTFELLINLKTARALGLDVPTALLDRADEVIE